MPRRCLLALLIALLPGVALATTVRGALPGDTTWSPAGNPYTLTGDVTVPPGVTLTLQPGVVVTFASSDGSGSGTDPTRTELIIEGTLVSQGTSASPVSITATNAYGVSVRNGALASLDYTTLSGGLVTLASHGITLATRSTVRNNGINPCVRVGGGTFEFTHGTLTGCFVALDALGGNIHLAHSLVTASGYSGTYTEAIQLAAPSTLVHNTLTGNNVGAVRIKSFAGTARIVDNIISSNGSYGLNFDSFSSPTLDVHHNLLWGQLANSAGQGIDSRSPQANPLFVGGSNYRITENSPARMAASDGTDLGAFPYAGDPTTTLQGILYTDKTLSGAHTLAGDLTVRPGVKLTLSPGASLTFAASDAFGSGTNPSKTELIVGGALVSQGTAASPITLTATGASGVSVLAGASATLDYTTLSGGLSTLTSHGTTTATHSTVQSGTTECVRVGGGTFHFTHGTLTGCAVALRAVGGNTHVASSLVTANGTSGGGQEALQLSASTRLERNTVTGNSYGGVRVGYFWGTVTLQDNIISSNGTHGLTFESTTTPTRTVRHNLLWGHTDDSVSVGSHPGASTGNPLFVGGSNYRITENSPARMAASDGTDLGAFPYAGDPTTPLQGILYTDKTLSGAHTLAGDLRVPAGIQLTLTAGTHLTFAPGNADGTGQPRLIIEGTLLSQGTSASPVNITATNAEGTIVASGATATFEHTTLTGGDFTLTTQGTTTLTHSTVRNGAYTCVHVSGGTFQFTRGTLSGCGSFALRAFGGTTSLTYSLVRANGFSTRFKEAIEIAAPASLVHNTLTGNSYGAVRVSSFDTGAVNIFDNIITSNGNYGLNFVHGTASPARSVHHNNVWGHGTDYTGVAAGTGALSTDPQFLSATDYSLKETSPCRGRASDGTDLGALPYAPPVPARVVVLPLSPSLMAGGTQQFTATAYDSASNPIPNRPILWSASGAAGTISPTGLFTAGCAPGSYPGAVTATIDGKSGTASVTLTASSSGVASVTLTPPSATVAIHGTQQFTATSRDACGNTVSSPVSWEVLSGGGSISSTGLFTAGSTTGTVTVRALSGAVSATATITVTGGPLASIEVTPGSRTLAIQGAQQFSAVGRDAAGNVVPVTPTWSVVQGGGTIGAGGLFTAGTTPGTYANTVQATSGGISGFASVTVQAGPLASIQVTPSPHTLPIRGVQQFTATGKDSAGNPVPVWPIWGVMNGGGTITSNGTFTAGTTPGTFHNTVRATINGISGHATVTVQPGALASIEVTPTTATLPIEGSRQFSARGKDSAGNPVPVSVTWSVVNGGGTIDAAGTFTAGTRLGTYANTIQATSGGISGFASVTVQPGALASLEVTPGSSTLSIHGTRQFTATGKDSAGNVVSASVTWSVVKGGGTIDAAGLFTAGTTPGTYTGTVKATSGGVSAVASVTVQAGALASLEVTPNPVTLGIHGVQRFTATGKDSAGNTVPASVTWSVVGGGGTLAADGTFTAGNTPGTYTDTVKATSGSVSGFASVTVTAGALASLEVTPGDTTLAIQQARRFTVTGRDSAGNTVPTTVTWSVVKGGGTIDASGLFTAGTVAGTYLNTVQATAGALSATASLTVEPGAVHSVVVAPSAVTLGVRGTQRFSATATDAFGNGVSGTPTWSVQPQSVGTIGADGTFTAGPTAGHYAAAIRATLAGVSGSADVTLTPGKLARVVVTPASLSLEPRGTWQLSARGEDADGNAVAIAPVWSVTGGAGTITPEGLFTATQLPGSYPDSIQATVVGLTGTASVTVAPGSIHRVVISPVNPTVAAHGTVAFTAKAFDAFDNELGPLSPTWELLQGGGTLDARGVFTAGADSGTFQDTVKVTLGGMSVTTSVTVAADFDGDGMPDAWELANGFDPNTAGDASLDSDGDMLTNAAEFALGTHPRDADADDDGVLDGQEQQPGEDADGDGLPNVKDADSDNDGLPDGTEMAVTTAHADTDVSQGRFVADADPLSSTDPHTADTDGDGRKDGEEDANHDGKVDPGETDPNAAETFCEATPDCGSGQVCGDKGVCVASPDAPPSPEEKGGGGCSGTGSGTSVFSLLLLALLGRVGLRRQRA